MKKSCFSNQMTLFDDTNVLFVVRFILKKYTYTTFCGTLTL